MRRLLCAVALVGLVMSVPGFTLADNQEIAKQIASNLSNSGKLKDYSVQVKVEDGTAWLIGTVPNQQQMAAALSIAKQTGGINRVVNNLSIGSAQNTSSGLRQPSELAGQSDDDARFASNAPQTIHRGGVVQAGLMDMPEQAKSELMVAGPIHQMDENVPASATSPVNTAPKQMNQPMPLPMNAAARQQYMRVAMQNPPAPMQAAPGEAIGTPQPMPAYVPTGPGAVQPYKFDHPQMPGYAWPSYAAYPNYAAVTYPKQYSPTAWPYIGPFYPYPQVPLGWRKVTLEWNDGWWFLDFKDSH